MAEERSVGELLDELFGFESVAKRQTALEQYDRGELLRKARSRELLAVIGGVEAAERAARESAVRAVDGYVRRVEFDCLARARKQALWARCRWSDATLPFCVWRTRPSCWPAWSRRLRLSR